MPTNKPTYYIEHRDECRENSLRYAINNREKIAAKQREYYYRVLKPRRTVDRMWNNADKPKPESKPEPRLRTTKRFLAEDPVQKNPKKPRMKKSDASLIELPAPSTSGVSIIKTDVVIDWNKL